MIKLQRQRILKNGYKSMQSPLQLVTFNHLYVPKIDATETNLNEANSKN